MKVGLTHLLVSQSQRINKDARDALGLVQDAVKRGGENSDYLDTRTLVYPEVNKPKASRRLDFRSLGGRIAEGFSAVSRQKIPSRTRLASGSGNTFHISGCGQRFARKLVAASTLWAPVSC